MELNYSYALGALIIGVGLFSVLTRRFDPFAPVWMFMIGFLQVYVIQPISYYDWAIRVRGPELVEIANSRALWALSLFLAVYYFGFGRWLARKLPRPPQGWSPATVTLMSPVLVAWGLFCAGFLLRGGADPNELSAEVSLLHSFPFVMLVAGILLIVTGRTGPVPRPGYLWAGIGVSALYVLIWMFNGKRSHSLIGVLSSICAFYVARRSRPSWPVLITTACLGVLAVGIAIGWRKATNYERSFGGFATFVADFQVSTVLESLNMDDPNREVRDTYETEEYGGYLVMLTAVPNLSEYDYGASYLRVFSTYIPRVIWPSKPLFGREQWVNAWIAGSEKKRDSSFTGPAIGILGATQLNGGAVGTAIVMTCLALLLRAAYEYFRLHAEVPWVQAWWSLIYYNAWFMTVNDDPMIWYYYNWGFTTMPILALLWIVNRGAAGRSEAPVMYSHNYAH